VPIFAHFLIKLAVRWAAKTDKGDWIIQFGMEGGLKLDPSTFYAEQEEKQVAIIVDLPLLRSDFLDDFLTSCSENGRPKTPGEDGLKIMKIISVAYLSSNLCREVNLRFEEIEE
jgi:hypothetical protein